MLVAAPPSGAALRCELIASSKGQGMGYICVHGHFYQPPRENPWLEAIELQESAHPYHDWNERITAECYARNAASRILNDEKRIARIVNNYSKISFNFGPTLISWIETSHPALYQAILDADKESQQRFSGHGSALAQAYNHMIMPLANDQDKRTQVLWGVRDFERRFKRKPEGMWLPETAVDLRTLEMLAEAQIKFTILAPNQAQRIRKIGGRNWKDVSNSRIDPTMAYRLRLPSGRSINLFFYDGPISRAIAFEGLLDDGRAFAERLLGAFSEDTRPWPELVHIATDGETYGHHHRNGEMALTYALDYIESNQLGEIINYGQFLEQHAPTHEVEIFENSSWSCVHGVERWRSNCGCNSGGHPGWNQEWRKPLREALDWLRDDLIARCEEKSKGLLNDLWQARDGYIEAVLDRSGNTVEQFLEKQAGRKLDGAEQVSALKLLEIQRHAMLMYTSCGWFFDELSGIETVQVIQYAGRAVQLAQEALQDQVENSFLELLSHAKSNIPEHGDGAAIYQEFIKPAFVDLKKLGCHYAIRSLFEPYEGETRIYCYTVKREAASNLCGGERKEKRLEIGKARFTSTITQESDLLCFTALQGGDFTAIGAARHLEQDHGYEQLVSNLSAPFSQGDMDSVIRAIHEYFSDETYTLGVLFKDEQRRILTRIVEVESGEAEAAIRRVYPKLISILRAVSKVEVSLPLPRAFHAIAEFALNTQLQRSLAAPELNVEEISVLAADAEAAKVSFDVPTLEYFLRINAERIARRLKDNPGDMELMKQLDAAVGLGRSLPFEVNFWTVQNICYDLLQSAYPAYQKKADEGEESAGLWVSQFRTLAEKVSLSIP
jgi:alpha-amylase/alpha-mannosidase (GH57 family)